LSLKKSGDTFVSVTSLITQRQMRWQGLGAILALCNVYQKGWGMKNSIAFSLAFVFLTACAGSGSSAGGSNLNSDADALAASTSVERASNVVSGYGYSIEPFWKVVDQVLFDPNPNGRVVFPVNSEEASRLLVFELINGRESDFRDAVLDVTSEESRGDTMVLTSEGEHNGYNITLDGEVFVHELDIYTYSYRFEGVLSLSGRGSLCSIEFTADYRD
jgi:hypothetical protein